MEQTVIFPKEQDQRQKTTDTLADPCCQGSTGNTLAENNDK